MAPIMPENHAINRAMEKANKLADLWCDKKYPEALAYIQGLNKVEAGVVMAMVHLGLDKPFAERFMAWALGVAEKVAEEKPEIDPSSNPFTVEKIDVNECALWMDMPDGTRRSIMTVEASYQGYARGVMAERMADLVNHAQIR